MMGYPAGVGLAVNDEVEPAGEFAIVTQEIACSAEAGRFTRLPFRAIRGYELHLMWAALVLEIQRDGTSIDADRLATRAVKNADGRFAVRVVDDDFGMVVFIAQHDELAAVRTDVTMAVIGASRVMIMVATSVFAVESAAGPKKQPRGNDRGTEKPIDRPPHASTSLFADVRSLAILLHRKSRNWDRLFECEFAFVLCHISFGRAAAESVENCGANQELQCGASD